MKLRYLFLLLLLAACQPESKYEATVEAEENNDIYGNPPAEGFNQSDSDPKAIALADSVMLAMGGRKTWDTTNIIQWDFFGRRKLLWDKAQDKVRIESSSDSTTYLIDLNNNSGRVMVKGNEIEEKDSLNTMVERGKSIWINDSYWLVMPFKLKDSGVTIKYLREDTIKTGAQADVIGLTFDGVGVTPQNKYEVYITKRDNLVKQWAFYRDAEQEEPSAVWPWDNYQEVEGLMLSFDRSDDLGPHDVKILDEAPEGAFNSFEPILYVEN